MEREFDLTVLKAKREANLCFPCKKITYSMSENMSVLHSPFSETNSVPSCIINLEQLRRKSDHLIKIGKILQFIFILNYNFCILKFGFSASLSPTLSLNFGAFTQIQCCMLFQGSYLWSDFLINVTGNISEYCWTSYNWWGYQRIESWWCLKLLY